MNRRKLITGLVAFAAAPAIVRAENLMPIRGERYFFWEYSLPILPPIVELPEGVTMEQHCAPYLGPHGQIYKGTWTFFGKDRNIYSDEEVAFRKEEYSVARAA